MLTCGRILKSMLFGGREFRTASMEGGRGPSVGTRNVMWNSSWWCLMNSFANSTSGIKWLSPGQGTIAMHAFFFILICDILGGIRDGIRG